MRGSIVLAALAIASPTILSAQSVDDRLLKTAIAAARVGSLAPICGDFYVVDRIRARELAADIAAEGIERFGRDVFERAFSGAMVKIQTEALRSGAAIWCPRQRDHFGRIGMPNLIGGNIP